MWSFALRRHPARLPCRAISASAEPLVTRAAFLPALVTVAAENDSSERRQITREMEICERAAPLYEVIFVIETDGQRTDGRTRRRMFAEPRPFSDDPCSIELAASRVDGAA